MVRQVTFVLGLALLASGCGQSEETLNKSFDEGFRKSCNESASANAPDAAIAAKYCDCVLDKVNKKYSGLEKAGLSTEDLTPMMTECMKDLVPPNG